MQFEFATATRIIFGRGSLVRLTEIVPGLGTRALVVTGRSGDRAMPLVELLDGAGVESRLFTVPGEPTVELVADGVGRAREAGCELVVGFGGGSVIDTAKAIAALLGNEGDLFDYLEVIGAGRPLLRPSLPWIAVPTTAGTGSEVTRNAVLASPAHRVKVSLRSPLMLARVALVDPALTDTLPPSITAGAGLDALTQLVEPFTSRRANPLTDALCREGMARVARSLWPAFRDGPADARPARDDLALAALLGGLALANAGLGAAHGFAGPIGGAFPAPHGAICGRLLASVMDLSVRALHAREPDSEVLARYDEVGRILTGRSQAGADDAVAWIGDLVTGLGVPRLGAYGIRKDDLPALVEAAAISSSMQANPIRLTRDELIEILERSL